MGFMEDFLEEAISSSPCFSSPSFWPSPCLACGCVHLERGQEHLCTPRHRDTSVLPHLRRKWPSLSPLGDPGPWPHLRPAGGTCSSIRLARPYCSAHPAAVSAALATFASGMWPGLFPRPRCSLGAQGTGLLLPGGVVAVRYVPATALTCHCVCHSGE